MSPHPATLVSYPEIFAAFYRGRFMQLSTQTPVQGHALEVLVNTVLVTHGISTAVELLVLGTILEVQQDAPGGVGTIVESFFRHAHLEAVDIEALFGSPYEQGGVWYTRLEEEKLPQRAAAIPNEIIEYLSAIVIPLIHKNGACTPDIRGALRRQASTALPALYTECESELLRHILRDNEYLSRFRHRALANLLLAHERTGDHITRLAEAPLSSAEREQLIHRIMVGLPFEQALRNLMWKRYVREKRIEADDLNEGAQPLP